jgi:hypothetical protein
LTFLTTTIFSSDLSLLFHFQSTPHSLQFSRLKVNFNMQLITPLVAYSGKNVIAHPSHDIRAETAERTAFMQTSKRDLSHCAAKMKARGMDKRSVARRAAVANDARKKRSIAYSASLSLQTSHFITRELDAPFLKARDVDSVLNTTHLSSESYTNASDETILFAGNNSSCVLSLRRVSQRKHH